MKSGNAAVITSSFEPVAGHFTLLVGLSGLGKHLTWSVPREDFLEALAQSERIVESSAERLGLSPEETTLRMLVEFYLKEYRGFPLRSFAISDSTIAEQFAGSCAFYLVSKHDGANVFTTAGSDFCKIELRLEKDIVKVTLDYALVLRDADGKLTEVASLAFESGNA